MSNEIDWDEVTIEERKQLFSVVQSLRSTDSKISWRHIFDESFGENISVGTDTEKNFRNGILGKPRCGSIYKWLCKEHSEYAREFEVQFFKNKPEALSWLNLLKDHGKFENVEVPVLNQRSFGLTGRKSKEPTMGRTIKRSEAFCFEVNSPIEGQLLALEEYEGHWHIMPLYEAVATHKTGLGTQWVPSVNGNPDPLEEETDMGKHRYAFFIASNDDFKGATNHLPKEGMVAPSLLNAFANHIGVLKNEWHLLRINVIFEG